MKRFRLYILATLLAFLGGQGSAWTQDRTSAFTQTIALNAGYNWVSPRVEITLADLEAALVDAVPGTSINIVSQNGSTSYSNTRWKGSLRNLDVARMCKIKVEVDCEITLDGMLIDPAEHPITIGNGANWIGFPLSETMAATDAFSGFAVSGDMITSQTAFAVRTDGIWRGTLTTLEPGHGYNYYSATAEDRTFVFIPSDIQTDSDSGDTQYESHWSDFNYLDYQSHCSVVAPVRIGDDFIINDGHLADWEIAAYVGDECRGHAFLSDYADIYGDPYPIVELLVYYDNAGEEITFKLYNHASHSLYAFSHASYNDEAITICTEEDHLEWYIDYDSSVCLHFFSTLSTDFALQAGWNWFSSDLDTSLDDLKDALVAALPANTTIIINSQYSGCAVYDGTIWRGALNSLAVNQMYMIKVEADCEITLTGELIDPAGFPITISNGFNWMGFPFGEEMTIINAFAGFVIDGDKVYSKSSFANYSRNRWNGQLRNLEPGHGYIYESASSEARPFVFPTTKSSRGIRSTRSAQDGSYWSEFNNHSYKLNQPVVATVTIDGTAIGSGGNWEDLEIAAFVDDVCRGSAFMRYAPEEFGDQDPVVELPVYYTDPGETVTYRLYNHAIGIEYGSCTPNIDIVTGDEHVEFYTGSDDPVILSFIDDSPADVRTLAAYPHDGVFWATFCCERARYTLPEGAQAYTMDAEHHLYRLGTDGLTIPANTAVIIIADSEEVTLTKTDDTSEVTDNAPGGNILNGSDSEVCLDEDGKVPVPGSDPAETGIPYVLGVVGDKLGFYEYKGANVPANKAYYVVTTP